MTGVTLHSFSYTTPCKSLPNLPIRTAANAHGIHVLQSIGCLDLAAKDVIQPSRGPTERRKVSQ
eukprot:492649-Amphidinium_carterae.1